MGFQARILTEVVAISSPRDLATHRSNPSSWHCRRILYQLNHQESPTQREERSPHFQNEAILVFVLRPFCLFEISFVVFVIVEFERDEETCFTIQNMSFLTVHFIFI